MSSEYFNKALGKKLREVRQKRGETLESLGEKINLSHQQLFKYEQGDSKINSELLFKLSQLLAVPINYFFDDINRFTPGKEYKNIKIDIEKNMEKQLRILLIEDDPNDILILGKILGEYENVVELFTLNDGEAALKFIKTNFATYSPTNFKPHLILLDLNLPKFDGLSFLKSVKSNSLLKHLPIIIMTNSLNRRDMELAYALGACGYICKSFDYEVFSEKVNCMINYWRHVMVVPE